MVASRPFGSVRVALLALFAGLAVVPCVDAQTMEPTQVHLAYGADASTAVTVAFAFVGFELSLGVRYGEHGEALDRTGNTVVNYATATEYVSYITRITGLRPDTVYDYKVVSSRGETPVRQFRTISHENERLRITAWGDQGVPDQTNPAGESDGDAPVKTTQLGASLAADVHLHAGDISYANGAPRTWDRYFEMVQPLAANVPYMTAVGNHEREAGIGFAQYDQRLGMPPSPGRWWTSRIGNVQIISLDTEHACTTTREDELVPGIVVAACSGTPDPTQLAFLHDTLAKARSDPSIDWIIPFHHYPIWSDGPHGSNLDVRKFWGPLYDEYHVELVLQGHDHVYERTKQIVGNDVAPGGTTYVTVGTGGASHYAFQSPADKRPAWEAARDSEHYGALLLEVNGTTLHGVFQGIDGNAYDSFWISKPGPAPALPVVSDEPVDGICVDFCGPCPTTRSASEVERGILCPSTAAATKTPAVPWILAGLTVLVVARLKKNSA